MLYQNVQGGQKTRLTEERRKKRVTEGDFGGDKNMKSKSQSEECCAESKLAANHSCSSSNIGGGGINVWSLKG